MKWLGDHAAINSLLQPQFLICKIKIIMKATI